MQDIHPEKPLIVLSLLDTELVFVLSVLAVATLVMFMAQAIMRKRTPQQPAVQHERDEHALDAATQAMRALDDAKRLLEAGEFHALFLTITVIIKNYLQESYGIHARALTTTELAHLAKLPRPVRDTLHPLFLLLDKGKFSNTHHDARAVEHIYTMARNVFAKIVQHERTQARATPRNT